MQSIKKRLLCFLLGTVLSTAMTVFLIGISVIHAIIIMSFLTIVLAVVTCRTLKNYKEARLICENPILDISMASVAGIDDELTERAVNIVVSGFGIFMDGKPYKFGHSGVELKKVVIDRESIALSFEQNEENYSVRLLHGISKLGDIEKLKKRLQYETGVTATISGW